MEIKSLGTFNMSVGRPIDAIRFEVMNGSQIKYQSIPPDGLSMPVQSIVKINTDPHPDYFTALDKLVPFAIKVLDLGNHWKIVSSIGSLKLDWTYNNNDQKFTYKIAEITIARESHISEVAIPRSIKFGGIIIDDIPWDIRAAIETIMDEAWLYCSGKKTAQLNLFDLSKTKTELEKPLISVQMDIVEKLLEDGIQRVEIDAYIAFAGTTPTIDGFIEWQEEQWETELSTELSVVVPQPTHILAASDSIAPQKRTRSKSTKKAS